MSFETSETNLLKRYFVVKLIKYFLIFNAKVIDLCYNILIRGFYEYRIRY